MFSIFIHIKVEIMLQVVKPSMLPWLFSLRLSSRNLDPFVVLSGSGGIRKEEPFYATTSHKQTKRTPGSVLARIRSRNSSAGTDRPQRESRRGGVSRFQEIKVYLSQDRTWKKRHHQTMFDAVALAAVGLAFLGKHGKK